MDFDSSMMQPKVVLEHCDISEHISRKPCARIEFELRPFLNVAPWLCGAAKATAATL